MGIVGGRRGHARPHAAAVIAVVAALLATALSGCAADLDESRAVQTEIGRVHQVVDVEVTTPSRDHAPAVSVTYSDAVDDPTELTALVRAVGRVTARRDYPAYLLTLVPAVDHDSALTVDEGFVDRDDAGDVLTTWFAVIDALIGPVRYVARPDGETITVDSGGGAAHDIAEVRRIRHGTATTTWTFRAGGGTFTASGRVRASDAALFQAVQRNAGSAGQPAWASGWQLDRRATHVRLDLDVDLDGGAVVPAQVTIPRFGRAIAPLADTSLTALLATGLPAWLRLHDGDDVFGSWASGQEPATGRDPHRRGWDAWLVKRAAAVR
jgi:hypothetical protein